MKTDGSVMELVEGKLNRLLVGSSLQLRKVELSFEFMDLGVKDEYDVEGQGTHDSYRNF